MWHQIETLRKGRWWFFWNFVVRGKSLTFSVYSDKPGRAKIEAATVGIDEKS